MITFQLQYFGKIPTETNVLFFSSDKYFSQEYNRPYFVNQLNFNDTEAVAWRCSIENLPKNVANFTGKHLRQTTAQVFSCNFFVKVY